MKTFILIMLLCCTANSAEFVVTAFCHCAACCGEAGLPTASGVMPKVGRTASAPRRIPFGTRIWIEGVGWRSVEDRAAMRYDNRIDVFMASHAEAKRFGKQTLKVIIYEQRNR